MKQYKKYMDNIQASDTLHQRLLNLKAPQKRAPVWNKYKGVAAVLAVALLTGPVLYAATRPEPLPPELEHENLEGADLGRLDIAIIENPGESLDPGMKTIGGYEVYGEDRGPNTAVSYYMLPYIEYGMADDMAQMALDWDVPPGSVKRDLTQADFAALFGGEDALSVHLGWGGWEITGWAAWKADGAFWGAFINGYKGPLDHFEFAFTAGDVLPPTCIAYGEDGVVNQIWDVPVTAWGHNGKDGCGRRVELLHDGYGFRFDLTATDVGQAEDLMSRATRLIIVDGVAADSITADGAVLAHPWKADPNYSVGEPNWNDGADEYDSDCPYCADGTVHTHPHNPGLPVAGPDSPTTEGYSGGADPAPAKGPDDPAAGNLPDGDPAAYEPRAELPS